MDNFSLLSLLQASGKRMKEELRERLTPHPGELGSNREEIIRDFLRRYLPRRFEVSHGFVFDASGRVSKQLDIVVVDSQVCPRFETAGGIRFFPCESVVAVGQVKSSLTGRRELKEVFENLESAKSLDRSAGGRAVDTTHQERIDPTTNHLHQIFTFVVVIGKALDGKSLQTEFLNHILESAPHLWPNLIYALDKYIITFCCDGGVCPNPMDARGVALQPTDRDDDLLMKLYLLLGMAIETTRVASLPYWEYLSRITPWSADVGYSCDGPLPPYLSSLANW